MMELPLPASRARELVRSEDQDKQMPHHQLRITGNMTLMHAWYQGRYQHPGELDWKFC